MREKKKWGGGRGRGMIRRKRDLCLSRALLEEVEGGMMTLMTSTREEGKALKGVSS